MRPKHVFRLLFWAVPVILTGALLTTPVVAFPWTDDPFIFTSSEDISLAQQILVTDGYLDKGGFESGKLDDATQHALREFQRDHGLPLRGELDAATMAELTSHQLEDSDGDGVIDAEDMCPDTPKGTPVDDKGCPLDSDGDGVHDGRDRCPDTPRGATVDQNGCPTDRDGDGVYDGLDKCPNTPRGAKVDSRGCPTDSDGDGVYDGLDKCPDTPRGKAVDAQGCPLPEKKKPLFEGRKTLVLQEVNFELNSADLTSASKQVLDRVANSLKEWPEVKVEVGGHTDTTGGEAHNLKLSERRASSARDYLISKGVAASQLTSKGYGESKPLVEEKTKADLAENRRVELTRLD